jgi:tetratricopeptide (TPR) repeat protein
MVAPSISRPYERLFSFEFSDQLLAQNIVRIAREKKEPVYTSRLPDAALNDEWTAAELSPDDARLQYNSLVLELRSHADKLTSDQPVDLQTALKKLPPDRRDKVTNGLARLSKCAGNPDHAISASVQVALASVYFILSDVHDSSQAAAKAVSLDPSNDQAGQALVATYLVEKRYPELATILQEQIKHRDSPYKRICLARVYQALGNIPAVTEQVVTGQKNFPEDLLLNLALVDGFMKSKAPEALTLAGQVISYTQMLYDRLTEQEKKANEANFDVTRGIYFALTGKIDVARLALERVLNDDPDNDDAKEALDAIGAS